MKRNTNDIMSGLTHFVGALLAVAGLVLLLIRGHAPSVWYTVSFSIFGVAMILVYTFSTLYHWLPVGERSMEVLRKLDHIMIFVFIAATYTPVCLVTLQGAWGWSIFGVVWGVTLAGIFLKIFWLDAPRILYTGIYLLMGWVIVVGIWPLVDALGLAGLGWLALGGLFYSLGAVIYAFKWPDPWPGVFGFHEVFHIFILLGSFSHFWMMYFYV